jgi:Ca-activated chloride channel homolog
MRKWLPGLLLACLWAGPAPAAGLLIPEDRSVPPLAMVDHKVSVTVDEQVAVTTVEQTFRNHAGRPLEATYVFPVPRVASVNKFTMWVDGKEVKGELVEADRARAVYTDIVRRTQDPGLLEYVGNNLLRLRVFPVPANGDQKVSVRFTAVNACDAGLVEYVYPLRTDGKSTSTPEKFTLHATLRSAHKLHNVYSPTHAVTVTHKGDTETHVSFEKERATLDKDFQLYYTLGDKDVGLSALTFRPEPDSDGHFMLLISPRAELARAQQVPRDVVLVLDTSGSMQGPKMEQARKALKFCLNALTGKDRFAVLNFATTVNSFADSLTPVTKASIARATRWVEGLEANGGTAIDDALSAALGLRSGDSGRSFTVVFFTDGQPTVGETDPERIVKRAAERNTSNTRVFTFGVGDDVNAAMLDRLAEQTRAVSTYVRPEEDIEVKVSGLYAKISHPVLTDLKLSASGGARLSETYPNELPDLFHGGQVVVLGRYSGKGHTALRLSGKVGGETREFVYEVDFAARTKEDRTFVADLWARRKVGYLLDQVRRNGEKKELVEEVKKLAKRHGITTPYTSYLVVPDNVARPDSQVLSSTGAPPPPSGRYLEHPPVHVPPPQPASTPLPGVIIINNTTTRASAPAPATPSAPAYAATNGAEDEAELRAGLARGEARAGKLGVDLAVKLNELRSQDRLSEVAARRAAGRTCRQVGGAWVDEAYEAKTPVVGVRAMSAAYFRMLEKHPELKEVFALGTRVVWVTPCGSALVIDPTAGKETMRDAEIEKLFVKR